MIFNSKDRSNKNSTTIVLIRGLEANQKAFVHVYYHYFYSEAFRVISDEMLRD